MKRADARENRRHGIPHVAHNKKSHQHGVVTIEYAIILMLGVIPLLYFTISAFMIFFAKQTLTLAAADGARAALHYQATLDDRKNEAKSVAEHRMQWLTDLGGSASVDNTSDACTHCITVVTHFENTNKFLLPGTQWMGKDGLKSAATIQLAGD